MGVFQKSEPALASQQAAEILKSQRPDWSLFRTVEGLQQRAGVPKSKLRRLVLKELADNGLDSGANVRVGKVDGGYFVEDDGSGIEPDDVARLFSIARPMMSSKLWRLPTRGALGNGLRVVAGAVLASRGKLTVITRNRRIELRPEHDGSTTIVSMEPVDFPVGTRVEIGFAQDLPEEDNPLYWARVAIGFGGASYAGKTPVCRRDATSTRASGQPRRLLWCEGRGDCGARRALPRHLRKRHARPVRQALGRRPRQRQGSQAGAIDRCRPTRRLRIRLSARHRVSAACHHSLPRRGMGATDDALEPPTRLREPYTGDGTGLDCPG